MSCSFLEIALSVKLCNTDLQISESYLKTSNFQLFSNDCESRAHFKFRIEKDAQERLSDQ